MPTASLLRSASLFAAAWLCATPIAAQTGSVEYRAAYDGMIDRTVELAKLLESLDTIEQLEAAFHEIAAASKRLNEEQCALKKQGIPIYSDIMHPNDFEYITLRRWGGIGVYISNLIDMDREIAFHVMDILERPCE